MKTIYPGIHTHRSISSNVSIETDRGVVQIDTGLNQNMARKFLDDLRAVTDAPIHTIIYSHGHNGHNTGAKAFLKRAEERGETRPRIVAHERLVARWNRYRETFELQNIMAGIQFNVPPGTQSISRSFVYPDVTFRNMLRLQMGNRIIEVLHAPSETDDSVAVWIPEEKVLFAGPAFINSCPNPGTPFRTQRDSARWADTLDRLIALGPEFLIPTNWPAVEGAEKIRHLFSTTAEALRYLRREVVERMNRGMTDVEILHDITYPAELFELPWMNPEYGCPDYIVRDIYRSENGWWDRNPTNLHPEHPDKAARAVFEAIGDRRKVIEQAKALKDSGEIQLALHVIDLLALAPGNEKEIKEAGALKAELINLRAEDTSSFVSTNIYKVAAERLKKGG